MSTLRRAVLAVICGAIVTGCQSGTAPGSLAVTLDQSTYMPGDVVTGNITNTSSHVIDYNLCARDLDRHLTSGWTAVIVIPPPGAACNTVGYILSPGSRVPFSFAIPNDLAGGIYRVRFLDLLKGVSTPSFEIGS
jgi:hypothetical protein